MQSGDGLRRGVEKINVVDGYVVKVSGADSLIENNLPGGLSLGFPPGCI